MTQLLIVNEEIELKELNLLVKMVTHSVVTVLRRRLIKIGHLSSRKKMKNKPSTKSAKER